MTMCSAELRRRKVRVVDFNAWQQSHTKSPIVDLVSAIAYEQGGSWTDDIKKTLLDVSLHLAKIGSRGLIDRDAIEPNNQKGFDT